MHRPLSLMSYNRNIGPSSHASNTPNHRQRADSLVFSLTSQKAQSPIQTMLLSTKQDEVFNGLSTLQLKLQYLDNKIKHVQTQSIEGNDFIQTKKDVIDGKNKNKQRLAQVNVFKKGKQNQLSRTNKIGKIVSKDGKDFKDRTVKLSSKRHKVDACSFYQRNSLISEQSNLIKKNKQFQRLTKELQLLKKSIQKSQRSKSKCSQRLSSKQYQIKCMKKHQKKQEQIVHRLRAQLMKSQSIRQKQKKIILVQQKQLNQLKQLCQLNYHIK